jgi:hypothetical protein
MPPESRGLEKKCHAKAQRPHREKELGFYYLCALAALREESSYSE